MVTNDGKFAGFNVIAFAKDFFDYGIEAAFGANNANDHPVIFSGFDAPFNKFQFEWYVVVVWLDKKVAANSAYNTGKTRKWLVN